MEIIDSLLLGIFDIVGAILLIILIAAFVVYAIYVGSTFLVALGGIGLFLWGGQLLFTSHPAGLIPLIIGGVISATTLSTK